ncbi:MAG TPA: XrtA system polysaccharide deacetylase [Terriglobia bacterium]|nr:XrtA system polysaccharide deacetylase [Terriglobia bacterium]
MDNPPKEIAGNPERFTKNYVPPAGKEAYSVFTVDVEDWFHILDVPSTPPLEQWASLPSRVERNFHTLLDLFDAKRARTTCFFLGWIADRFPHLVKAAAQRGHEVASHGYAHQLVRTMTRQEFHEDIVRSKKLLEDLTGAPILGYRAPGFSLTRRTAWLFEELLAAGYVYDSSLFPAKRGHGGDASFSRLPTLWGEGNRTLIEFPVTVTDLAGCGVCLFGGGYLRFFPYPLIRHRARALLAAGQPIVYYIHPREIDPTHPRLPMNPYRRFKSYYNLNSTWTKVSRILDDFQVSTFRDLLAEGIRPPVAVPLLKLAPAESLEVQP